MRLDKLISERKKIAVPDFSNYSGPILSEGMDLLGKDILINDLLLSELFDTIARFRVDGSASEEAGEVDYGKWVRLGAQLLVLGNFERPGNNEVAVKLKLFDVTTGNFLIGKRYQGAKTQYRWMIHRFVDEIIGELIGMKGSNATQIAFSSFFKGKKEIYSIDRDGANPKRLTNDRSISLAPAWSPNGEKVAYTSYRFNNPNLFIVKRTGEGRKMVSNEPGLNDVAAWSPDGEKIAYVLSRKNNPDIYLLHKDGARERITFFRGIDTSPAWSPDGKKLAYTSNRSGTPQIYILDISKKNRGRPKRISYSSSQNDDPAWSPDGKSIAYTSLRARHFEIVVEDLESNINLQLTTTGRGGSEHPSWSPNGRFIAFSSSREGKPQIYIMKSDGSGLRKLTFLEGGGHEPSWSPRFYQ